MAALPPGVLSAEQERAILALLNQPTIAKASEEAQVGQRTLYRWLKEPAFSAAYREARREAFRHAIALTQKFTPVAVQVLVKIATDQSANHAARVSAAQAILKFGREGIELDDIASRLEALELDAEKGLDGHKPLGDYPQAA